MKFRIIVDHTAVDLTFGTLFDAMKCWRDLQWVGVDKDFIHMFTLTDMYEWDRMDAEALWSGLSKLLAKKEDA